MAIQVLDPDKGILNSFFDLLTYSGIYVRDKSKSFYVFAGWSIFSLFSLCQMIWSVYGQRDDLDDVATLLHHICLLFDILVSVVWSFIKRPVWEKIFNDIHNTYDYNSVLCTKYLMDMHAERKETMSKVLKLLYLTMIYTDVVIWMIALVDRFWFGKPVLLGFPVYTFLNLNLWTHYLPVIIWEIVLLTGVLLTVYGILGTLFLFYDYISKEIFLLTYALMKTEERALEIYEMHAPKMKDTMSEHDLMAACYHICTTHSARHHTLITKYFENASIVFRFSYLIIVGTGLVVFVAIGFTLISNNLMIKLKFAGILITQLVHLYICFWFGERIREISDSIRWTIYDTDWLKMPKTSISTLRLIMVRTMKPLELTTLSGQVVDLDSYMNLIKGSYSYFNMILQTKS